MCYSFSRFPAKSQVPSSLPVKRSGNGSWHCTSWGPCHAKVEAMVLRHAQCESGESPRTRGDTVLDSDQIISDAFDASSNRLGILG